MIQKKISQLLLVSILLTVLACIYPVYANASSIIFSKPLPSSFAVTPCGDGKPGDGQQYTPSIDLGCEGKGNPIEDTAFGIIKFLSDGVGIVITASLIWAGIQYITSTGDPQSTATAVKRIRSNVMALLLFIFAYAIVNYIVPGAVLQ